MTSVEILSDLSAQWTEIDRTNDSNVLRACTMTFIATSSGEEDAAQAKRTLRSIAHEHPSRSILVRAEPGVGVSAHVFAECWMPFGHRQQICSEGIELTADPYDFEEVARLLVPLRAPDLPTVLWSRDPIGSAHVEPLLPVADKIVFDTQATPSPQQALAYLRLLRSRGHRVADLHWTRITPWREAVSTHFETDPFELQAATIHYGGTAPSTCALYFAAWLRSAVPSIRPALRSRHNTTSGIAAVELTTSRGPITFEMAEPPSDKARLLDAELNILTDDPVYDRVLG